MPSAPQLNPRSPCRASLLLTAYGGRSPSPTPAPLPQLVSLPWFSPTENRCKVGSILTPAEPLHKLFPAALGLAWADHLSLIRYQEKSPCYWTGDRFLDSNDQAASGTCSSGPGSRSHHSPSRCLCEDLGRRLACRLYLGSSLPLGMRHLFWAPGRATPFQGHH